MKKLQKRCPSCMEPMGRKRTCPCGYKKSDENLLAGPLTGSLLKGRYSVGNIHKKGKDSTVYLAFDEEYKTKVFIRQFTAEGMYENSPFEKQGLVEHFINYEKTLASVSICKLLPRTADLFIEDDNGYLVTEHFVGTSLNELLESGWEFDADTANNIVTQLAEGLKVMHNAHIIYGALSPETLYILSSGEVKLFGIGSPFYSFITKASEKAEYLNPCYTAPELFEGANIRGTFCDVYSLAAIYYRLLTNETPPIGFLRQYGENLIAPKSLNNKITASQSVALLNALNWQAQSRTPDMDAFIYELGATTVSRKLSPAILFANFLGISQKIYYDRLIPLCKKVKALTIKAIKFIKTIKQRPNKKLIYAYSGGALALLLVLVLVIALFSTGVLGGGNTSSITWYYGSGIETTTNSNYIFDDDIQYSSLPSLEITIDSTNCPNVKGLTKAKAIDTFKKASLEMGSITYAHSNSVAKDLIIYQSVEKGKEVKLGKKINIIISSGPTPSVTGKDVVAAANSLKAAGFSNIVYSFVSSEKAAGTVTSVTTPEIIYKNTAITLTVSGKGKTVSNYANKPLDEVLASAAGFNIATFNESGNKITVSEGAYNAFVVVDQSVAEGTMGYEGMQINLTIKFK